MGRRSRGSGESSKAVKPLKRFFRGVWIYLDVILVIGAATLTVILELVGDLSDDTIRTTTLALLGVVAFILARERNARHDLEAIAAFVEDHRSDRPYEVQSQVHRWVIENEGARTTAQKTQKLRFTRNEVSILDMWRKGDGATERCVGHYRLGMPNSSWREVGVVAQFPAREGTKYIFCLGEERHRDDVLEWRVTRELTGAFPPGLQAVGVKVKTASLRPRIEIEWDDSREPREVELEQQDPRGNTVRTALPPTEKPSGGYEVSHEVAGEVGTTAKVWWQW